MLQDGLWGFTGYPPDSPPPSPSLLPTCLPALSDWCVTEASLIRTPCGTEEEETAVREAGLEVHKFVIATWKEREWETAWFVNPPVSTFKTIQSWVAFQVQVQRLQSVPALAHIHVFARYKSTEEVNAWESGTPRPPGDHVEVVDPSNEH